MQRAPGASHPHHLGVGVRRQPGRQAPRGHHDRGTVPLDQVRQVQTEGLPVARGDVRAGLVEDRGVAVGLRDDSHGAAGLAAAREVMADAAGGEVGADLLAGRAAHQPRREDGDTLQPRTDATLTPLPPATCATSLTRWLACGSSGAPDR